MDQSKGEIAMPESIICSVAKKPCVPLFEINVTEEDIQAGVRGSPKHCPVAKAIRRIFPAAFHCNVSCYEDPQCMGVSWSFSLQSMKSSLSYNLPNEVVDKINCFDEMGTMKPFSFFVYL